MLEIAFSESAQGGLRLAQRSTPEAVTGIMVTHEDGSRPTRAELRALRRQAEQEVRKQQMEAIPLGGSARDVYGFPLCLSVGPIAGEALGPERKAALTRLYGAAFPQGAAEAENQMNRTVEQFRCLLGRLRQREAVRVWYSDQPDERCGLSWFCWELQRRGVQVPVHLVALPRWEERTDGTLIRCNSWGEMEPGRYGAFLSTQWEASPALRAALAQEWELLRRENGSVRAVVNGWLRTVPEDFYDPFLRRELAAQPEEFHQAHVIGAVLGRYLPGISDCWLALRMEAMLQNGELEAATKAPEDGPAYHRRLRKTASFHEAKYF